MSITFEITNSGVFTTHHDDKQFECAMQINGTYCDMSAYITIDNANEAMPQLLQIFDEVSQEIAHNGQSAYVDMAWAHIKEPTAQNPNIAFEIRGTENAITMIQHGLAQNDIDYIYWS